LALPCDQAGNVLLQIENVLDAGFFHLLSGNGTHGNRNIHDVLFTLLRSHDNFFKNAVILSVG